MFALVGHRTVGSNEGKTDETFAAPSGGFLLMRLDRLFYKGEVPGATSLVLNPAFTCRRCLLQKCETRILLASHNLVSHDSEAEEAIRGIQWFGKGTIATFYKEASGESYDAVLVDAAINVVHAEDDASDSASLFDGFTRRPVACAMCGHRLGWEHAWMPPSPSPSPEAQGVLEDIQGMRGEVASGADAGLSAVDTSLEDALPALGSLDVGRAMVRGMTSTSPTSGFEASPLPPGSSASRGEGERGAELGLKLLSMLPPGVAGGAEGGLLVVALGRARDGAHEGSSHLEECLTSVAELCKTRAGGGGGAAGEDLDWLLSNLLSEVARLKAFREGKEKERERENSSSEAEANGGVLAGDGGPESLPARTASSPQRRPSVGSGSASPYKDFGAAAVTRGTRNAPFRLADGTWVRPQTSAAASAGNASPGLGGRSGASKSVKSPLSTKSKPPPKRAVSSCS